METIVTLLIFAVIISTALFVTFLALYLTKTTNAVVLYDFGNVSKSHQTKTLNGKLVVDDHNNANYPATVNYTDLTLSGQLITANMENIVVHSMFNDPLLDEDPVVWATPEAQHSVNPLVSSASNTWARAPLSYNSSEGTISWLGTR